MTAGVVDDSVYSWVHRGSGGNARGTEDALAAVVASGFRGSPGLQEKGAGAEARRILQHLRPD